MADNPFDQFDAAQPAPAPDTAPASASNPFDQFDPAPSSTQVPSDQSASAKAQNPELQGQAPILITGHRSGPLMDSSGRVILQDANAIPQGQDTGFIGENGGTHTESDARFAGANKAVQHMLKTGVSSGDILAYLKSLGATDEELDRPQGGGVSSILQQLGAIKKFQHDNPHYKGDYVIDLEHKQTPNSVLQNAMGSDVGATTTAIGNMSTGDNLARISGALGADQDKVQTALDASAAVHPVSTFLGDVAGAGLGTAAIEEGLGRTAIPGLARVAPEAAEAAEGAAGFSPYIRPAAANATYGAVTGASATNTGATGQPATIIDRIKGAAEGAGAGLAGYATGEAAGGAAGFGATRAAAAEAVNRDFGEAADRQGITYMAADRPNSLKSRLLTTLSNATFGAVPIAKQAAKNISSARGAVGRAAEDIGTTADRTGAGQAAQSGARQFMTDTEAKQDALYQAIPIPAQAPANVSNTRAALTNLAQSFQSNPKLAAAFDDPKINAYLDALTPQTTKEPTGILDQSGNPITRDVVHDGNLSWEDLKDFRTRVGQIIGKPGITTDGTQISQLRSLYAALSEDMRATAQGVGPKAVAAFERANTYARARADRIENVVSLILGKNDDKGAQSAFEALQRLGNEKGGDAIKLGQALRSMPQDDANTVRATMLDDMAHASAGKQDDTHSVFSPAEFVTNWNKLSDRAKSILFTGQHRADLDDIAKVLSGMKASQQFANGSKTGLSTVGTGTIFYALGHPLVGIPAVIGQYLSGSLLASPRFARWLAAVPKKPNPQALSAHIDRLDSIAQGEPQIANDVMTLKQRLADVLQQGTKTRRSIAAGGGALGVTLETQRR